MKVRNGFVSNSSSSSFVLCFKDTPKSAEEIKKIIFDDEETITNEWTDEKHPSLSTAQVIFDGMKPVYNTNDYKKVASDNFWGFDEGEIEDILKKCKTKYVYNFQCGNECGNGIISDLEGCFKLREFATHIESMHWKYEV